VRLDIAKRKNVGESIKMMNLLMENATLPKKPQLALEDATVKKQAMSYAFTIKQVN
jgi:hypothetical protein